MHYGDISYSLKCGIAHCKELIVSVLDRRRLQKRRTSTTCLPRKDGSWQSTQLIGAIMILSLSTAAAYTLKFYDCTTSKLIHRYPIQSACSKQPIENPSTHHYDLLQKIDYSETTGWSCEIKRSQFYYYCGVYGHNKILETPKIEIAIPVSPEECRKFINTKGYRTTDGRKHVLTVPGETIFSLNEKGVIHEKGTVSCEGERVKVNNEIIDRVVILAQIRIILRKELYKLTSSKPVEVISRHLKLPKSCRPKLSSCSTGATTYIWTPTLQRCSLQKIQSLKVEVEGNYLVDHINKVILKKLGEVPSPNGCPTTQLHSTPYEELFVAPTGLKFPDFDATAIHTEIYIRGMSDYALYSAEKKLAAALQDNKIALCAQSLDINDKRHHHLHDNVFAQRRGDILFVYKCKSRSGKIKAATRCYQDIPIDGPEDLFIDPVTKISKTISAPANCNPRFPLQLLTQEGTWIKITPQLVRIDAPEAKPIENLKFSHESLENGGIYLETEWKDWRATIEEQNYQDAIISTLTYGNQVNQGLINDPQYNYDLSNLNPLDVIQEEMNIFKKIDKWILKYGSYLSLAVLLLEGIKLIMTIVMLFYSFAIAGFAGLIHIGKALFCSQWDIVNTKRNHARKEHEKRKRRENRRTMRGSPTADSRQTGILMSDFGGNTDLTTMSRTTTDGESKGESS